MSLLLPVQSHFHDEGKRDPPLLNGGQNFPPNASCKLHYIQYANQGVPLPRANSKNFPHPPVFGPSIGQNLRQNHDRIHPMSHGQEQMW